MNDNFAHTTVGEIVASDYRTASVFDRFGIDFCCGGRRSVDDACRTAAVDPHDLKLALDELEAATPGDEDVTQWTAERLIGHIVSTHHTYTRTALATIGRYLAKLVSVHGPRHPELVRVAESWAALSRDLQQHMMKEEHILFPYILELSSSHERPLSPFGTVENPIRMMQREHEQAGDELGVIRALTHGFTTPPDGCATYRICFEELAHFERDLHRHVHLENNVLFPRAIALERGAALVG
jgi:regulator of cell morphogenesis and NO signaling